MKDPNVFVLVLALVGLIIALIHEFQAGFKELLGWAVVAVALGLALAAWPG